MKAKIVVLVILAFFVCGCDVTYNITIDDRVVQEDFSLVSNSNESYQNMPLDDFLKSFNEANIPLYFNPDHYDDLNGNKQEGISYYNIHSVDSGINVKGEFTLLDIYRSSAIKACFDELSIQRNDSVYRINTSNSCKAFDDYPLLEQLTIDLEIGYDVISSNADQVSNHHYVWKLNKDNYDSKYISIVFSTTRLKNNDSDKDDEEKSGWANEHPLLVVLISFVSFFTILGVLIFVSRKMR